MITKNDILKMIKHVAKKKSKPSRREIVCPERDWLIGLGVTTLVFLLCASYAGYLFYTHFQQTDKVVEVTSSVEQYDQKTIESVLNEYDARKQKFESLRTSYGSSTPVFIPPQTQTGTTTPNATATLAR
jgi:uncharacterized membrane protein YukC